MEGRNALTPATMQPRVSLSSGFILDLIHQSTSTNPNVYFSSKTLFDMQNVPRLPMDHPQKLIVMYPFVRESRRRTNTLCTKSITCHILNERMFLLNDTYTNTSHITHQNSVHPFA